LYRITEVLARRANLQVVPRLYFLSNPMMNALTVGDGRTAAIGITQGLLQNLNTREMTGVLAHEISHIQNRDTQVMRIASIVSRVTGMFAFFGQLLLFFNLPLLLMGRVTISWFAILLLLSAPTLSSLLQMALSRAREYDADIGAARLTGDPEGLASALYKMEKAQGGFFSRIFGRSGGSGTDLFRTHPQTQERVNRLAALAGEFQAPPIGDPGELVTWDRPRPTFRRPLGWYTIRF
jgi:heat shock protein HtpX